MHAEWAQEILHDPAVIDDGNDAHDVLSDRAAERADVNYLSVPVFFTR